MTYRGDSRGALWRKWDLHVHTPESYVHEYGDRHDPRTWETFLQALVDLPAELRVVGINDYFSIAGYRKVRAEWLEGRFPYIECVLPVVELRLGHLAGNSNTQRLNYHVVFSDEVDPDEIERSFLNQLIVSAGSFHGPIGHVDGMAQYGAAVKGQAPLGRRPTGSDVRIGFDHAYIPLETITKALAVSAFRGKHLRALGYTEWASMRWGGGGGAIKRALVEQVDFLLGCSSAPSDHDSHRKKLEEDGVPHRLLDASDAHRLPSDSASDRKMADSMTWIRADPTFEGLRRAVQRYDQRVFIGDEPPQAMRVRTQRHRFMRSLQMKKREGATLDEVWFDADLELNPGLVAIIGNQGSGKSALTDTLALLANSEAPHFSFLNDKRFRKSPSNKAEQFIAKLGWEDGTSEERRLDEDRFSDRPERARYVPQQFFEYATNEIEIHGGGVFYTEIEKAVFSHVPTPQRQDANNFRALVQLRTRTIEEQLDETRAQLGLVNHKIAELEEDTCDISRSELKARIAQRRRIIEQVAATPPTVVDAPPDEADNGTAETLRTAIALGQEQLREAQRAEAECYARSQRLASFRDALLRAKAQAERIRDEAYEEFAADEDQLIATQLMSVAINLTPLDALIADCRGEITQLKAIQDPANAGSAAAELTHNEAQLALHTQSLGAARRAYEVYLTEQQSWQARLRELEDGLNDPDALRTLTAELARLEMEIPADLVRLRAERRELCLRTFELLQQSLQVYRDLALHVKAFLQSEELTREKYRLEFDLALAFHGVAEAYFHIVKHQGPLAGSEQSRAWVTARVNATPLMSGEDSYRFASELAEKIVEGKSADDQRWAASQAMIRSGRSLAELYDLLFGLTFLSPRYRLALGDRLLEQLSPGERGILLLIFYLIVDKSDLPLIIDQPEGNLNNQAIYEHLVPVIRKAKEKRQIVMVSHNPNIVVGCDADQIIHAHIDQQAGCCVTYTTGAMENPVFREFTIEKLEGTRPAFDERSQAYDD
jgi:ABC-type lipoprotein export system ATPase subunit